MHDYVVLFPNGDCKEYRSYDRAYLDAVHYNGCLVDVNTQRVLCDYTKKQIPEELDLTLGNLSTDLSCYLDMLDEFRSDPEIVQIRIQMRKLSVLINRYCSK